MQQPNQIAIDIEQAALRAFPALEEADLDGWMLRYANGHSRRTNSVQPISHRGEVDAKVEAAEAWYAERGIPCTFRLTPMSTPTDLDATLEEGGYLRQDPTSVQTSSLADGRFAVDDRIEISDHPSATWFDIVMDSSRYMMGRRPTLERTLPMIEPPAAFAVRWDDGRPIGTGMAVADGDLVGLFSIATRPDARRRGIGRIMSETLLD
jgi:hypothetical protein